MNQMNLYTESACTIVRESYWIYLSQQLITLIIEQQRYYSFINIYKTEFALIKAVT